MWDRRARITNVHDGDTVAVILDQGFGDTKYIDLRLLGVFAPELKEHGGDETRMFVQNWLTLNNDGRYAWPFVVTTARKPKADTEQSTFGRYVGTITTLDGTENLNAAIIEFVAKNNYGKGVGGQ